MNRVRRLLGPVPVILVLVAITVIAAPVRDGIPGSEADSYHGAIEKRFYGPWLAIQKVNGEYADYGDYGAHIGDFQPGPEEVSADNPEIPESDDVADFPSSDQDQYNGDDQQTDPQDGYLSAR